MFHLSAIVVGPGFLSTARWERESIQGLGLAFEIFELVLVQGLGPALFEIFELVLL